MHYDQLIWNGLEQDDIATLYNYLRDLVVKNFELNNEKSQVMARFLIDNQTNSRPSTSNLNSSKEDEEAYFELNRVFLGKSCNLEQYFLIPYNIARLTFFIFVKSDQNVKLGLLKDVDAILAPHMIAFMQDLADSQLKSTRYLNMEEKEIKYIYFNCLNLAQKTTITNLKEMPKHIVNLISQLSKDLRECVGEICGEIFVKSGKDYWLACKKSDLREVYVIVSQKNANLTLIDEEVKRLCSTNFSNILFMD
jgi:hypothetical protein